MRSDREARQQRDTARAAQQDAREQRTRSPPRTMRSPRSKTHRNSATPHAPRNKTPSSTRWSTGRSHRGPRTGRLPPCSPSRPTGAAPTPTSWSALLATFTATPELRRLSSTSPPSSIVTGALVPGTSSAVVAFDGRDADARRSRHAGARRPIPAGAGGVHHLLGLSASSARRALRRPAPRLSRRPDNHRAHRLRPRHRPCRARTADPAVLRRRRRHQRRRIARRPRRRTRRRPRRLPRRSTANLSARCRASARSRGTSTPWPSTPRRSCSAPTATSTSGSLRRSHPPRRPVHAAGDRHLRGAVAVVEQPADRHRRRCCCRRRRRGRRRPSTRRPVPPAGRCPASQAATPAARSPSPKRTGRLYCRNSFSSGSRTRTRPGRPPRGARPRHRPTDGRRARPQQGTVGDIAVTDDERELVTFSHNTPVISRWRLDGTGPVTTRVGEGRINGHTTPPERCCSSPTTATSPTIRRRTPRRRRRPVRLGPGRQPDHRPARRRQRARRSGPGRPACSLRSSPMAPPVSTT